MSSRSTEKPKRGVALALGAAAFAAVFLLAFQSAARAAPREAVVLAMLGTATLFNGLLVLGLRRASTSQPSAAISRKVTWLTIVAFTVLTIGGNVGVAGALERLGPGLTGTILQTQIFLVVVGGRVFLSEQISPWFVLGAGLAFGGFVVLGLRGIGDAQIDATGVAFALMASASFGAILLMTRAVISRIDPVFVNVARLLLAVVFLSFLPGAVTTVLALPSSVWLMVVFAAACGPFASRLCLMFAARDISASRTKMLTLVSPVIAFGLEWAVLGDAPGRRELIGGGLIMLGVVLPVVIAAKRKSAAAKANLR